MPEAMVKIQKFQDEYLIIHLEQPIHYNGFDDFLGSCLLSQRSENNTKATTKRYGKILYIFRGKPEKFVFLGKVPQLSKSNEF